MHVLTSTRKHRLLLELGRGGMGTVYLAMVHGPAGFQKLVAVKHLGADLASERTFVDMFLDEARVSARLNHPNICQTHEVGFDGRDYYIEMEYLDGSPYAALLRRASKGGGLPLEVHLWVLAQTCAGLHYAHQLRGLTGEPLGIVHRDVSPHNVFVTYEGAVKLLDFGIARAIDSHAETTAAGAVKGKAAYMAPEQARRESLDPRADVFAVGVMLWQAIARRRMWEGLEDLDILLRLRDGDVPKVRDAHPGVAEGLERICDRALAPRREDRFESAEQVQEAIEGYLEDNGLKVGPKRVAAIAMELFAERRAAVQAEIERALLGPDAPGAKTAVPQLHQSRAYQETSTGDTAAGPAQPGVDTDPIGPLRIDTAPDRHASVEITRAERARTPQPSGREPSTGRGVAADRPPQRASGSARLRPIGGGLAVVLLAAGLLWTRTRWHSSRAATATAPVGSTAAASMNGQCSSSAQCVAAHGDAPYLCRKTDHRCVAVESEDCTTNASAATVRNDDTLWVGAMFSYRRGPADMLSEVHAIELAQSDFARSTGGIPRPGNPRGARPFGAVVCDDGENPQRAAKHLVDLGVPAVIGFGQDAVELVSNVFLPAHVLVFDSRQVTPALSALPMPPGEPRLLFRLNANDDLYLEAEDEFIERYVQPGLQADPRLRDRRGRLRLAIVRASTITSLVQSDYLFAHMRLNGKTAVENGDGIRRFVVPVTDRGATDEGYLTGTLPNELLSFHPDIVVMLYDYPDVYRALEAIEAKWPAGGSPRPTYVFDDALDDPKLLSTIGRDEQLRHRLFGNQFRTMTEGTVRFVQHYDETYPDKVSPATAPTTSYDAAYLVGLAAAAAGDVVLTGPALAGEIARLQPPGVGIDAAPGGIMEAVNVLDRGENVDLRGTSGSLDFDPSTGDAKVDLVIACPGVDSRGWASPGVESGVWFDGRSGSLKGRLACP